MKNIKNGIIMIALAGLVAISYITGIPSSFFINIKIADVNPIPVTLFVNILITLAIALILLKLLIPGFNPGFKTENFKIGLKKYWVSGLLALILPCAAFCIGLFPFNYTPTAAKVLFEGVIYYIAVGVIEEIFCRGLLLNGIAELFGKSKNAQLWAVVISASIFGLGHIFGTMGEPILLVVCKVVWAIALGIYFGSIYVKTKNLWLVALLHTVIDFCGIPFCFSTIKSYPTVSTVIILITYLALGAYGLYILKHNDITKKVARSVKRVFRTCLKQRVLLKHIKKNGSCPTAKSCCSSILKGELR